jgi:lipoate---protein ligase
MVTSALTSLGINAYVTERHDIAVDGFKISFLILLCNQSLVSLRELFDTLYVCDEALTDKYVSGSAYKIVSARAYHHGTMLVTAALEGVGAYLRVDKVIFTYLVLSLSDIRD